MFKINDQALIEQANEIEQIRSISEMQGLKYHILTYGCQMNEHDSEKMSGMLEDMGYLETPDTSTADLIIINTCAVRENAEMKVLGNIGHLKPIKEENPNLIIAICGCMMQEPNMVEKIKKSYPYVDLVFGTHNYHQLPEFLYRALTDKVRIIEIEKDNNLIIEGLPVKRKKGIKAFVTIMQGCNNFCSYCIVPYTRGRERSREISSIVEEIKGLVADGVREVTLLGQNVNSFKPSFPELLKAVNEIDGLYRIRFMTSHPKDFSEELIKAMKELDKVCEYIHLPVQSGSTAVLKAMNRKYTREDYLEKVALLKKEIPGVSISTDIIIGFPGETEEDVEYTISMIKEVEYDSAFTFIYSKREGTPAATKVDNTPKEVISERFNRMLESLNEIVIKKNKERQGLIYEVLVDDIKGDGLLQGRTREGFLVTFSGGEDLLGTLQQVKITNPKKFSLEGELCD